MTAAAHSDLMDSVYRRQRHIDNFTQNNLFHRDRLIQLDVEPARLSSSRLRHGSQPDQDRTASAGRYALWS
jgi:hypothetical protein